MTKEEFVAKVVPQVEFLRGLHEMVLSELKTDKTPFSISTVKKVARGAVWNPTVAGVIVRCQAAFEKENAKRTARLKTIRAEKKRGDIKKAVEKLAARSIEATSSAISGMLDGRFWNGDYVEALESVIADRKNAEKTAFESAAQKPTAAQKRLGMAAMAAT